MRKGRPLMQKVSIYHNVSRDASFGYNTIFRKTERAPGYGKRQAVMEDEKHPLVKVFEYEADDYCTSVELLNRAFEEFNVGTGPRAQAYRARRLRSLSVGDVIQVDNVAFACASFGWDEVDLSEAKVLEGQAAVDVIRERYEFRPSETELTVTVPL
jgi:folylpolyglutamate synthase/dihydropteroate synthase